MRKKINSVAGLLTNLRWDWLNLIFFVNFIERGVRSKVIFDDEGGGGVQTPPKKDDIIYEQPLTSAM